MFLCLSPFSSISSSLNQKLFSHKIPSSIPPQVVTSTYLLYFNNKRPPNILDDYEGLGITILSSLQFFFFQCTATVYEERTTVIAKKQVHKGDKFYI